jgi:hypothetical protein
MGKWIVEDMPTDEVKGFCRLQKATGATKCEGTDKGGGLSDVLVVFPDKENFVDQKARTNK